MSEDTQKEKLTSEERKALLSPEKLKEIEEKIQAGKDRRTELEKVKLEAKALRKKKSDEMAQYAGITFRHFRPRSSIRECRDGNRRFVQPAKGGITVAIGCRGDEETVVSVAICTRDDSYDKVEGRYYAFTRLKAANPQDDVGCIRVLLTGQNQIKDTDFIPSLVRLAVRNAVANIRRAGERNWFIKQVVVGSDF